MAEKMLVTQALDERDLLVKKINEKIVKAKFIDTIRNNEEKVRPQYGEMKLYPADMLQVVGHTPVVEPTKEGNLLTVDTFSTYRDGSPIGDETFVVVDTEAMEYETIYQKQ